MSVRAGTVAVLCLLCLLALPHAPRLSAETLPLAAGADFRVLVWNVSRGNFFEHAEGFVAVLSAADADVLILDEMPDDRQAADVLEILRRVEGSKRAPWQLSYGGSGFGQRSVIALRSSWHGVAEFDHLAYPEGFLDWMRGQDLPARRRAQLEADIQAGVAAHGIVGHLQGRKLLLVGVDLQCCGDSDDSWEEQRRLTESRVIRIALDQVIDGYHLDAVVVGGDFNTTRGRAPVATVQGDPADAERHLKVDDARHGDGQDWTWNGEGTPFPSKKLDYLLYSHSLQLRRALVFDPQTMAEVERARLTPDFPEMQSLSAHRPLLVDFSWR